MFKLSMPGYVARLAQAFKTPNHLQNPKPTTKATASPRKKPPKRPQKLRVYYVELVVERGPNDLRLYRVKVHSPKRIHLMKVRSTFLRAGYFIDDSDPLEGREDFTVDVKTGRILSARIVSPDGRVLETSRWGIGYRPSLFKKAKPYKKVPTMKLV